MGPKQPTLFCLGLKVSFQELKKGSQLQEQFGLQNFEIPVVEILNVS